MKRRRRRKKRYKTGIYESLKGGPCKYRSGWELAYIQFLDASPDVVNFAYEGLSIPYVSNVRSGRLRKYLPDFCVVYVDGRTEVIEIKPSKRLQNITVMKKIEAARRWCAASGSTFSIITEHELKALGII